MANKMNARSLSNLKPGESPGRNAFYKQKKNKHTITVTDEGWTNLKKLAEGLGVSVSEVIEQLGRGQLTVLDSSIIDSMQDALDSALLRQSIAETNGEFVSFDDVLSSRKMTVEDLQRVNE